jgi:hypothetical protein
MEGALSEEEPKWFGDDKFRAVLYQLLVLPVYQPNTFDPAFLPVRRIVAVYGQRHLNKADAVMHFCKTNKLPAGLCRMETGKTTDSMMALNNMVQQMCTQLARYPERIIVIDQADELAFNPETELVMNSSLELKDQAERHRLIFVLCFNRTAQDEHARGANAGVPPVVLRNRARFFDQVQVNVFMPAPDTPFVMLYFQWMLNGFVRISRGRYFLADDLNNEGAYKKLADAAAFYTPHTIRQWCLMIFYDICAGRAKQPLLEDRGVTLALMEDYMVRSRLGGSALTHDDALATENSYRMVAGLAAVAAAPLIVDEKHVAGTKKLKMTPMSEENADLQTVEGEFLKE